MSWQLAAVGLVLLTLAAGTAWYERSGSSTRLLALVATLAALVAVARVAFAPLPNVKPSTDIVLLSGYVLGGAPGFAVGAFGALSSNVVFGQGPWTPWMMLAWGGCGVLGAGVARATRRRAPTWLLAAVCGLAGLLHGGLMDASTWVLLPQASWENYVAVSATSVPYNVAHAVGNVAFCLAFGAAFVRILRRQRDRLDVRWESA